MTRVWVQDGQEGEEGVARGKWPVGWGWEVWMGLVSVS